MQSRTNDEIRTNFVETNGGKTVTKKLKGAKAVDALNEKKKSITDKKVKEALKLVDAVFVKQENFDVLLCQQGHQAKKNSSHVLGMITW